MCGISGLILKSKAPEPQLHRAIADLTRRLAHRGPDGDGLWLDAERGVALGQRRLAIIDLSDAGAQPMLSASGRLAMTYNGEIYNFRTLRRELEALGHVFRGHSDSEVLIEYWDRFGAEATLAALNGMYAIAMFDRQDGSLTLARDPVGIKPLVYHDGPQHFAFASELRALASLPGISAETNPAAVIDLMTLGCIAAPRTILVDCAKLQPGHILRREANGAVVIRPFQTTLDAFRAPTNTVLSFDHAVEQVSAMLSTSVEQQLISDVPLGAFLSGGIDSSLVSALAHKATGNLQTFTIGFEEAAWDEAPFAEAIAAHLGTRHQTFRVNGAMALDLATQMSGIYDEPFADSSQIPTALLCRMVRQAVTVALSGDGGDEGFGGYQRYDWGLTLAKYRAALPGALRIGAKSFGNALLPLLPNEARRQKLQRALTMGAKSSFVESYHGLLAINAAPLALIRPELRNTSTGVDAYRDDKTSFITTPLSRMQAIDSLSYLPDDILVKVDRASMAFGLEVRVPLLDVNLWRLAASLPTALHRAGNKGKAILRAVLAQHVPSALFERPKAGFAVPLAAWLRGPLQHFMNDLIDSAALTHHPVLDASAVRALRARHLSTAENHAPALWSVLMLLDWERRQAGIRQSIGAGL